MRWRNQALCLVVLTLLAAGCGKADRDRIAELSAMPVLWETRVIVSDPSMPDFKKIVPLQNSYDPKYTEYVKGPDKKGDYIPESVFAFSMDKFRGKPRQVSLRVGDAVSVLSGPKDEKRNPLYLVRTKHGTYAWVFSFHLRDSKGKRMARFSM